MRIKVTEGSEREWLVGASDQELYELLCSAVAWNVVCHDNIEVSPETIAKIQAITVKLVYAAGKVESKAKLDEIKSPFIRLIFSEINRLRLNLPDGSFETEAEA